MTEPVVVPATAKATIIKDKIASDPNGHIQLDHPVGTVVIVDLTSRRFFDFQCRWCRYRANVDVIDVVYDPSGACRYVCPVELLEWKETVH